TQHLGELHRVLAPDRLVGRHPLRGLPVALVPVGLSLDREQVGRIVGEPVRSSSVQNRAPRSHARANGTRWYP
ncbi:MAG: hypothetical protein QOG79_7029, partial [Mycobacterium sp.]|nr:hypothetical protein [Mycobacterium sp.]